jgi:preprotein translocase SecE subunit
VADETRRQRRDARRAAGAETPAPQAAPLPAAAGALEAEAPSLRRGGPFGFIHESVAELKKVDWPNRPQVVQGTVVVIVACAIIGAFLWGADQALRPFVRDILLGQ